MPVIYYGSGKYAALMGAVLYGALLVALLYVTIKGKR